jgi:RNA polymerase sigma factor (TIGR02999 family)
MSEVTRILADLEAGDPRAAEELLPLVYDELRRLAAARMAQEQPGHTLQPTALVHEAWLRLAGENHSWAGRRHFFAAAAEAMRRILIERARRQGRARHGGGLQRVPLEGLDLAADTDPGLLLLVDESLDRLARQDAAGAALIKLRFFVGLSNVEAAEVLGLSERTAKRAWAYARAWLYEEIRRQL